MFLLMNYSKLEPMNKLLVLFTILLCVISMCKETKAQPGGFTILRDTAMLKSKLAAAAKQTLTIQSDFVQEKNLSVMSEKIITKGQFFFKRDNMLRWEYTDPFKYLIVMNKNKILVKDENKEKKYDMQSNKMFQDINKMVIGSVQGKIFDTGDFKYHFYQNDKLYLVALEPLSKNLKSYLKTIHIYFDKMHYGVSKLTMEELSGDYTNIIFSNRKENAEISNEKFLIK